MWPVTIAPHGSAQLLKQIDEVAGNHDVTWLLLDIGGVLFPDPWETLILTPVDGLSDRLGVPCLAGAAKQLWPKYSHDPHSEDEYWTELGALCGVEIPLELVRQIEESILAPFPFADDLLGSSIARVGIVSDNTSFWYEKQAAALSLERFPIEPLLLSFELGVSKRDRPRGLFDVAAELVRPDVALVLDDRAANVDRAAETGFLSLQLLRQHNDSDS